MGLLKVVASFLLICSFPKEYGAAVRYIDLSYGFDENTLYWPNEEKYKMTVLHNGTVERGGYWYQKEAFSTGTHAGTHLDAPCHFAIGGWSVEQIPLNCLISQAAVIDVSQKALKNANYMVSIEDVIEWENRNGKLPRGGILLIRTGWARYWPDKSKYFGTNTTNTNLFRFPGISAEAAHWIIIYRNISGVGIDTPSIDYGKSTDYLAHRILATKNIYNLENVADMNELNDTGFKLHVMPMKLIGASGGPCRIFAEVADTKFANGAAIVKHSFTLMVVVLILFCLGTFPEIYSIGDD